MKIKKTLLLFTIIMITVLLNQTLLAQEKVKIKNNQGNSLLEINDETDSKNNKFGSLTLFPATGEPNNVMSNKIWINLENNLMFGDSPISGFWSLSGSTLTFPASYMVLGNSITEAASAQILNVKGRARMKSFKMNDGSEGVGKVLVSDANGVGTWQQFAGAGSISSLSDGKTSSTAVYLGEFAGSSDNDINNPTGNVGVGILALTSANNYGIENTAVGYSAMSSYTSGHFNTAIGFKALKGGDSGAPGIGHENTAIGYGALFKNNSGSGNVAIGYEAGYNETGSDKLYIHNSRTSSPLIYGDFLSADLLINGSLEVTQGITGTVYAPSDLRYKKNISDIPNPLENIQKLKGVMYDLRSDEFPKKNFSTEKQIGLIAQEVEKVFPSFVHNRKDGYKGVEYSKLTAVLVEAIKEQQKMIDELKKEIQDLKEKQ